MQKYWNKGYNPWRKVVLWGIDNGNPSLLILYGKHNFIGNSSNILTDDVEYTSYAIFRGENGHFPSYQAVRIIDESDSYYNRDKNVLPRMYYRQGTRFSWSWHGDSNYEVEDYYNLKPEKRISFPYFELVPYRKYVERINNSKILLRGLVLLEDPYELIGLQGDDKKYEGAIFDIIMNQNIYMRKKLLSEFILKNPPKLVYERILSIGSSEMISGLFLELAKNKDDVILKEAKLLIESDIDWTGKKNADGLRRCANIYLNALNPELRKRKEDKIRKSLVNMDLRLKKLNGKLIPDDKILEGATYRKYSMNGYLSDVYEYYDYEKRQYVKEDREKRYEEGPYTDGVRFKLINFKSTIQEAEIYGLPDVIGKIAYHLDAPRIYYYLRANRKIKALKYFQRYLKRIINHYAEYNEIMFMEAMKSLLTSYTEYDYTCKFKDNFQFNELLKYYLYHNYNEKPPSGWQSWYQRYEWSRNDNLLKLNERCEYKKEIWDRNLVIVADIAIEANIPQVIKACYLILKESPSSKEFIENIEYRQLIKLALSGFKPLSSMFMDILNGRLSKLDVFDENLMLALIDSSDSEMYKCAREYFKKTKGSFSTAIVVGLLLLDNIDMFIELFCENLLLLEDNEYVMFVKNVVDKIDELSKISKDLPDIIIESLTQSALKMQTLAKSEKIEVVDIIITTLFLKNKIPDWISKYLEDVIFSLELGELATILNDVEIEAQKMATLKNRRIIALLKSIKSNEIPDDSEIIDILDFGTSKSIKILIDILAINKIKLRERFSTLLIMFESDVTALNNCANEVFAGLATEKQRKLHLIIIDSPVKRAYEKGLEELSRIYGDLIPEEFILQMVEHTSSEVKTYISDKINKVINNLGDNNKNLFMYYVKTLLLTPNKNSKSKNKIYDVLPEFVLIHKDKYNEVEKILLDIGGSNVILDSERALVTLAKIRRGDELSAG